ncbi:PAS domain S-box-containing protein [Azospira oryzae]|uniref:histidine kinase n=1 Tax=Azospira oryzae TaxID=146939 RepID=A0ABY0IR28_9RHOO|nr:CHASE domain-containing protein [Azospira oryzae]RZT90024.1 PAS domain S-box-containing protein [Azospira oryzae]
MTAHPQPPPRLSRGQALLLHPASPWAVLTIALALSLWFWRTSVATNDRITEERFQRYVAEASQRITLRMQEHEQILRGAVGLILSSDDVTRQEWRDFFQALNLKEHYPGILALGYTVMLKAEERAAYEKQVRQEGFPDFAISPRGDRPVYSSIHLIEPFSERNQRAFGYDMYSDPTRRAAMELARDRNSAALTSRVTLVQEDGHDIQAGTVLYMPVYRPGQPLETTAQRRQALLGFVYSPFRMGDLMTDILGHWGRELDFEIYDGAPFSEANRLYATRSGITDSSGIRRTQVTLALPMREWTLRFQSTPAFEAELEQHSPLIILATGGTISLLLLQLLRSLAREVRQQQGNQAALAQEHRRLASIARLRDAYIRGHDGHTIFALVLTEILDLSNSQFGYITELSYRPDGEPVQRFLALSDIAWDEASRQQYAGAAAGRMQFVGLNGLYAAAIDSGAAVIANDPAHHPRHNDRIPAGHPPMQAFLGLPIFRDGRIVGSVGLANRPGGYDQALADYLQPVVDSCSQLIDALKDQQALQESENQLRQLCNSLQQLIWTATPDTRCDFLSRQWEEYTGRPASEQLGRAWMAQIHPEDQGRLNAAWESCIARGENLRIDLRIRRHDGQYRWFDTRASALKDREGKLIRWIGSNTDVQVEREMMAALSEARRIISQGQRLGHFASWAADLKQGRWFIPDFTPIVDWPPGEYNCAQLLQLAHAEDVANLQQAWREAEAGTTPFDIKCRILHRGELRWVHLTAEFERTPEGKAERAAGVARDITREVAAEEQIRQFNDSLERRVKERTAELAAANHELEGFAYAVSHDLRAPLRAITGFSQALLEDYGDKLEGEAREFLDEIIRGGRHLGELIDGLLTLSRCTRGELRREPVDISALAEAMAREIRSHQRGAHFTLEVEPGIQVQGDPAMLEVVMRNLMENAWKYSAHQKTPHIRVYADSITADTVAWCVADNGAGFDMNYANKLFKPFQRLHRQSEFAGTGIGLATVQRIIHRHGGDITASSAVNQGAVFRITLPT